MTYSVKMSLWAGSLLPDVGYNQTKKLPPPSICFSINLAKFDSSIFDAGMEIMTLIADRYPKLLINTLPRDPGAKHTQETLIHLAVAQRDAEGETGSYITWDKSLQWCCFLSMFTGLTFFTIHLKIFPDVVE